MTQPKIEPELIELHTIEDSASGKNAYYHFCHVRQQQVSYAVCLHTIKAIHEDRIGKSFEDCQRAHLHNDCYAKNMRAEEKAAGHALYYTPRRDFGQKPVVVVDKGAVSSGRFDMGNPSFARGWHAAGGETRRRNPIPEPMSRPAPAKPKPKSGFVENSMADVVNAIVAEEKKPVQKPVQKSVQKPVEQTPSPSPSIKPLPGESPLEFARRRAALMKKDAQ